MSTSALERYGDSGYGLPARGARRGDDRLAKDTSHGRHRLRHARLGCSNQSASINTSCVWLGFNVCQVSPDDKILNGNPSDAFSDRGLLVNSRASSSPRHTWPPLTVSPRLDACPHDCTAYRRDDGPRRARLPHLTGHPRRGRRHATRLRKDQPCRLSSSVTSGDPFLRQWMRRVPAGRRADAEVERRSPTRRWERAFRLHLRRPLGTTYRQRVPKALL